MFTGKQTDKQIHKQLSHILTFYINSTLDDIVGTLVDIYLPYFSLVWRWNYACQLVLRHRFHTKWTSLEHTNENKPTRTHLEKHIYENKATRTNLQEQTYENSPTKLTCGNSPTRTQLRNLTYEISPKSIHLQKLTYKISPTRINLRNSPKRSHTRKLTNDNSPTKLT